MKTACGRLADKAIAGGTVELSVVYPPEMAGQIVTAYLHPILGVPDIQAGRFVSAVLGASDNWYIVAAECD